MPPNVLFITCHDLGRHLNCYGRHTVRSDALDALAEDGVLFENAFCTAPQCSPSRAALHTGRHAHTVGMMGLAHRPFGWRLRAGEHHLAGLLREAGFETILLGVQHLTRTPEVAALGYDHYEREEPVVPAPELAARAEAFLLDAGRRERPFYLEVGFFEPHRPYDWGGAQPDDSKGVGVPPYLADTPEAREEFRALQGAIRRLDEGVGRILAVLDKGGLAENTWLIFVTDHGIAMPWAKCTLYDPGIEVALIMRWPAAGVGGGKRYRELISHVDVAPTILEGLGLPIPAEMHGRSFWHLLQGLPYRPNSHVFAEKTFHTAYEPVRCIRTETHKLIVNFEIDTRLNVPDDVRTGPLYASLAAELVGQRDPIELYNLREDPLERTNLAGRFEVAEVERELRGQLLAWMQATHDPLLEGPVASPFYGMVLERLLGH